MSVVSWDVHVACVSWIDRSLLPYTTAYDAISLLPSWIPKVVYGLQCTANGQPPHHVADFHQLQNEHDFRGLQFCQFRVEIEQATGSVRSFTMVDAVHVAGWTPEFDLTECP